MWEMLGESAYSSKVAAQQEAQLALYLDGWSEKSGLAAIAIDPNGSSVGAAWIRIFDESASPYHFVFKAPAQLVIACPELHRGKGIGSALLHQLLQMSDEQKVAGISLNVRVENPAARLYERFGFERHLLITNRVGTNSLVMWRLYHCGDN
jgi:[ribosomal protein S18]-alanine N-acetyltransferase